MLHSILRLFVYSIMPQTMVRMLNRCGARLQFYFYIDIGGCRGIVGAFAQAGLGIQLPKGTMH